jgi:hypothetical protein
MCGFGLIAYQRIVQEEQMYFQKKSFFFWGLFGLIFSFFFDKTQGLFEKILFGF